MAGKKQSCPPDERKVPIAGGALGGAGLVILAASAVIFVASRFGPEDAAAPAPAPVQVVEVSPPPPTIPTPAPKAEAWWDSVPDSKLAWRVGQLKQVLPQDQPLFESLGAKDESVRGAAYAKLLARLPELIRDERAKSLLAPILADCYVMEPAERNVVLLREWLVNQIPQEKAAFPPGFKSADLHQSFWAMEISVDALSHKAIRLERAKRLSLDLGKAFEFAIDPSGERAELRTQVQKLLALRCYRNLPPTAAKSVADALAIRAALINTVPQYLSPSFREKVDIEMAFRGWSGAKASWPAYSALFRDCLNTKDLAIQLGIVQMYAQADPELAAMMEPLLADKWKAVNDGTLNQAAKVKAIQKLLGVPDPTDRLTQLEKLTRETLAGAKSVNANGAILQDTARLSHASTLACALMQKEKGQGTFDDLIAQIPEIDQDEPKIVGEKKKPDDDPMPANAVVQVNGQVTIKSQLEAGSPSKMHPVALKKGRTYRIHLESIFDNYLRLQNSKGMQLAEDDDSGGGLNAQIIFTPPSDDNYRVVATSFAGKGVGAYTLTVQEMTGMGGPGFGFPPGFGPFPGPFPGPFGRRPPPRMFPPRLPIMMPGQPPVFDPAQPQPKGGTTIISLVDEKELTNLGTNHSKTRIGAIQNITAKLKGDWAQKDLTSLQASKIAKYLVCITDKAEVDAITPELAPLAKSRNLLLALADSLDLDKAVQKSSEAVVGALLNQPLLFTKQENWRLGCRKVLLVQALELTGTAKTALTETADTIRDYYKEQGVLLGVDAAELLPMDRPSQVLERVIKHVADKLGKQDLVKADQEYLNKVPRRLLAAQFVAQNDLEHTVLLQRVWIGVLALHLEQQSPNRAKEMRGVQDEWGERDRRSENALQQLRGGEETILRLWGLGLELK